VLGAHTKWPIVILHSFGTLRTVGVRVFACRVSFAYTNSLSQLSNQLSPIRVPSSCKPTLFATPSLGCRQFQYRLKPADVRYPRAVCADASALLTVSFSKVPCDVRTARWLSLDVTFVISRMKPSQSVNTALPTATTVLHRISMHFSVPQ
jgi:hypothetical protein